MLFKRISNVYLFPTYVREDGKYTIASVDKRINGTLKHVYEVTDASGSVVDTLPRLKEAKEKYANM